MRTCCWDIEATDLNAEFGRILTSAIKPFLELPEVIVNRRVFSQHAHPSKRSREKRRSEDQQFVVEVRDSLEPFDLIITWYGGETRYDLPMLNTRLLGYGEKRLSPKFHLDLYYYARRKMRFQSNRLKNVAEYFDVSSKTDIDKKLWVRAAMDGGEEEEKYIVEHNREDVVTLEKLYIIFMADPQLIKQIKRI